MNKKSSHILFISDNFPPEVNAPATRTYEHCKEWVNAGNKVTVITCAPNFPKGKVFEGYKNKFYQKEIVDGIEVIRVWSYITSNAGFFKRVLDYISFAKMAFFASFFVRKVDVIVATSPQFFSAVSGYFIALFKRKPWIMEVRDIWPESIRAVDAMKGSKILDFLEKVELFLYRKATKVIVVTDSFKRNITGRGIDSNKIEVVKNGVYLDNFKAKTKEDYLLKKLNLIGKFVVGYIGTHGMAHKLDFILNSISGLDSNIHFLFLGDGAEKQKLLQLNKKLNLTNTTFMDFVPKNEIQDYISITDIALVPLKKSDTFKTVIPSKIFENAAMKKPILLGVEGESKEIIESYGAGLCFEPENQKDFIEKLNKLYKDKKFYAKCQQGCENLANDFDRKKKALDMLEIIKSTI